MVCDWMIGIVLAKILLAGVWDPALVCLRKLTSSTADSEFSESRTLAKQLLLELLWLHFCSSRALYQSTKISITVVSHSREINMKPFVMDAFPKLATRSRGRSRLESCAPFG
jgi:hypothetical protein